MARLGAGRQTTERRWFVSEVTPHDLRHTWVSAQYCMHKDLLRLKHEGGWGTIQMVERYTPHAWNLRRGLASLA